MLNCGRVWGEALVGEGIGLGEELNRWLITAPDSELIVKLSCLLRVGGDEQYRAVEVVIKTSQKIGLGGIEHHRPCPALVDAGEKALIGGHTVDEGKKPR